VTFVLVSTSGDRRFVLEGDTPLVAGRDLTCDLPILDTGVSRRHASLRVSVDGLSLSDLGSRNGTWINGVRVTDGMARPGDIITLGSVAFTVVSPGDARPRPAVISSALDGSATIIRERAVLSRDAAIAEVAGQRLAKLVMLAQRLGGLTSVEGLLTIIVDDLFGAFDADRVAVLLPDAAGVLEVQVARDAHGDDVLRAVPRAISQGVAERQVALLTHEASEDIRTAGESVVQQSVRSAMAAPLLGDGHVTIGVLYVDNLRSARAFTDEDLHFLVAFAGIAAAAVERDAATARLRQAAQRQENFERYFSPQVAERIANATESLALGGHRQRVVVLFSDIRGFTAVAESLPPLAMAAQLNEYFAVMVDCVFAHGGALDKFIGDALLAYWGAPEPHDDDCMRALRAAQAMREALDRLNSRWRAEGRPELHAGVAIHTGDAFIGNIGSPRRLEYTVIGDTVNVTSKLCGVAAANEILITDAVRECVSPSLRVTERPDLIPVKRVDGELRVWTVTT